MNKQWLDINKDRAYPFKYTPVGIQNSWILDAIFNIPLIYHLPLYVSKVALTPTMLSLCIEDKLHTYVGIFSISESNSIVLMNPSEPGCFGKLIVGDINFGQPFTSQEWCQIEMHCTKVSASPIVTQMAFEGKNFTDVKLVDTDLVKYNVVDSTITVNNSLAFTTKCDTKLPILTINNIHPNQQGDMQIEAKDRLITISYKSPTVMEVGSPLTISDFNPYAITGQEGDPGNPGAQGVVGIDGVLVNSDGIGDEYGAIHYNGTGIETIRLSISKAARIDSSNIGGIDDAGKFYHITNMGYRLVPNATCIAADQFCFYIGTTDKEIWTLDRSGMLVTKRLVSGSVTSIVGPSTYIADGAVYVEDILTPYLADKLKLLGTELVIIGPTWFRYRGTLYNRAILDIDDSVKVLTVDGTIEDLAGTILESATGVTAIQGTVKIGNQGLFIVGGNRIETNPLKNWKSMIVESDTSIYIFEG